MSEILTSERGKEMLSNCPRYYQTSRVFKSYLQTTGAELDTLKAGVSEVLDQFFIPTATWGLDSHEGELELSSYSGKPYDQRQSRAISKLRGVGKVGISLLKKIAEAYTNGTVDIVKEPNSLWFQVTFVDNLGVPPNLGDLIEALENTIPSHMGIQYNYKYLLIKDVHEVMTIAEMETHQLTDFAPFEPVL